jgi:hypothetical protein
LNPVKHFENEPPLFIYPIAAVLIFAFSLAFFKGVSTHKKLTPGKLNSFSYHIFYDPLPIYHFFTIFCIMVSSAGILRAIINEDIFSPYSLIYLAVGVGLYPSVYIATNKFIKEQPKLKKV